MCSACASVAALSYDRDMHAGSPRIRTRVVTPDGSGALGAREDSLGDDGVSVWLADPAGWSAPAEQGRLLALLSADERERHGRLRFEEDRAAFLLAHGLLRLALSAHAPVPPAAWTFRVGAHGAPSIAAPASDLRFSLSHTRGLCACAVAARRTVGVDVEDAARPAPLEVAERYFTPGERRDIAATEPAGRARRFVEYWTLKEAYATARGLGLWLPFDRFEFRREPGGAWRVVALEPEPLDEGAGYWFHAWPTPTHQAALALGPGWPHGATRT